MSKYNLVITGLLIAILILSGGANWEIFRQAQLARQWLKHSYEVLIAIKDLNVAVAEAETGQRGYLLTGKDDYLAPYEATLGRIIFLQGELQRLTADNPSEQERLRALTPILQRKLGELAETVEIRRHAGFDAALRIMNRGLGRDLMKQVETNLASMIVEEQTLLLTRLAGANSHGAWVRDASLGGTAFAVLTLFWAAWRLNSAATKDALTGLLSRNRIWELLASNDRRSKPKMAAMLSIDLDSFRSVNQVFGSTIGDRLLVEASRRLKQIAGRNYVGRFGSDDFAIYCRRITSAEAERLGFATSAALAQPFEMQGRIFKLTASVGIAHTNNIGGIDLRQGADDALYVAKRQGGNQVVAFSRSMHDTRKALAELEQDLRLAIDSEGELTMAYQPVVGLTDRTLVAVEALARWSHPRLGAIPPDQFIELAETRGLIIPLGLKLMGIAIRQAALWHGRYPGKCPLVHVNISPAQFVSYQRH